MGAVRREQKKRGRKRESVKVSCARSSTVVPAFREVFVRLLIAQAGRQAGVVIRVGKRVGALLLRRTTSLAYFRLRVTATTTSSWLFVAGGKKNKKSHQQT